MDKDKAIKISTGIYDITTKIKSFEGDLKMLLNTKEFITARFSGEDGAEKNTNYSIGWARNSNDSERYTIAKALHHNAIEMIKNTIEGLQNELDDIIDSI